MRILVTTDTGRPAYAAPADDAGKVRLSVLDINPWTLLLHHGLITATERDAAEKHWQVWSATRIVSEGSSGFTPWSPSSDRREIADRMGDREMTAWRRFGRAQASIPAFCRSEVLNVCCYHQRPSNLRTLRIGLSALARFYRLDSRPEKLV